MPHLLKRLELNGFKSFSGKTVFDFPEGITAIVGPNGSGKSNIIDAIRWLLGEREAKNLRGGKGEDLIFAGTAKRARLSQAQATLYFENPFDAAQGKMRIPKHLFTSDQFWGWSSGAGSKRISKFFHRSYRQFTLPY